GSSLSVEFAKYTKKMNKPVFTIATMPFREERHRRRIARMCKKQLHLYSDRLLPLENDYLRNLSKRKLLDCFEIMDIMIITAIEKMLYTHNIKKIFNHAQYKNFRKERISQHAGNINLDNFKAACTDPKLQRYKHKFIFDFEAEDRPYNIESCNPEVLSQPAGPAFEFVSVVTNVPHIEDNYPGAVIVENKNGLEVSLTLSINNDEVSTPANNYYQHNFISSITEDEEDKRKEWTNLEALFNIMKNNPLLLHPSGESISEIRYLQPSLDDFILGNDLNDFHSKINLFIESNCFY
ncbi:MAG: hypothetical protein QW728_06355, partial [Thermoplasmata archaeon]